jgi:hypothetical protein
LETFKEYHEEDSKRQYELAVKDLKADKVAAMEQGDHAAIVEIEEALQTLKEAKAVEPVKKPASVQASDATQDPAYRQFVADNKEWFAVDREKTAYAVAQGHYLRIAEPNISGAAFFARISELMDEKYGTPKRLDKMEGSQGSGTQARRSGGKSYNDMPADAKKACDGFAGKLVGPSRAFKTDADWRKHYADKYFGEEA